MSKNLTSKLIKKLVEFIILSHVFIAISAQNNERLIDEITVHHII